MSSDRFWSALTDEVDEGRPRLTDEEQLLIVDAFAGSKGKGWIRKNCPLCAIKTGKPDKKESMGYNSATGGVNCFKCETRGKLTEEQRQELPFTDPATPDDETAIGPQNLPEPCWGYQPIFEGYGLEAQTFEEARAYFRGRGLTDDVGREAGVGGATWGINQHRIIVPLPDYENPTGPWRGWVGRAFRPMPPLPDGGTPPVYRYASRFARGTYLYGAPCLELETDEPVFVVEGTLDRLSLQSRGMDAVALLGKPLEYHVTQLDQRNRPVAVCLDGDAWEEGQALAWHLQHRGAKAGNIRLPPRKDPDEMETGWLLDEATRCFW